MDDGSVGIPQDSIKDAIADYLEYISYFDNVARDRDIEWVRVGHPAWEKKYGFENNALVVFETKKYRIGDYVKE